MDLWGDATLEVPRFPVSQLVVERLRKYFQDIKLETGSRSMAERFFFLICWEGSADFEADNVE